MDKSIQQFDSNNNRSFSGSYETYPRDLPKIEDELKGMCIENRHPQIIEMKENEHSMRDNNEITMPLRVSSAALPSNTRDSKEVKPHSTNTNIHNIFTDSQFSSSTESQESLDLSFNRHMTDAFSLKLTKQGHSSSPKSKTKKSPKLRTSKATITGRSQSNERVKRALFNNSEISVVKLQNTTNTSQSNPSIQDQFKLSMKKMKHQQSLTNSNGKPKKCFKTSLDYQMSKPSPDKCSMLASYSLNSNRFGSKRNKRFQGSSKDSVEVVQQQDQRGCSEKYSCSSCGLSFRYFCNLKSHFVLVHNLVRNEEIDIPNILSEATTATTTTTNGNDKSINIKSKRTENASDSSSVVLNDRKNKELYRLMLYGKIKRDLHFCELCEKLFKFEVNLHTHRLSVHSS